jgi:hypothetical protein
MTLELNASTLGSFAPVKHTEHADTIAGRIIKPTEPLKHADKILVFMSAQKIS